MCNACYLCGLNIPRSSALLCDRLKQEVQEQQVELKQERERLLGLSKVESELAGRLQSEREKCELLTSQASEVEHRLQAVTAEAEAERRRCLELQAGLGAQSSE
jgi:hypothetical protein